MPSFPAFSFWKHVSDTDRWYRLSVLTIAAVLGLALGISGGGFGLDRQLHTWRDALRSRPASGKLVFVEIDARSVAALRRWPWPRSYFAQAVEQLNRAGVQTIGFDVDFSARSSAPEDQSLARALAASRAPVLLPSFRQPASEAGGETVESLPIPQLRSHAMLGTVNIFPDPDGLVRSYPAGFVIGGVPRPSIGALLAGANGRMGEAIPIDGAIEPGTIPRVSFIHVLQGKLAPGSLAGKTVLIGASAIELGDRYPMPRHGVIPGAIIQLLAADTLLQGTAPNSMGFLPALMLAMAGLTIATRASQRRRRVLLAALAGAILLLPLVSEWLAIGTFRTAPAIFALALAGILMAIGGAVRTAHQARTIDEDTGLPNRRAMEDLIGEISVPCSVLALRIANYRDVLGVMGRARAAELVLRAAERVAMTESAVLHAIEEGALGWISTGHSRDELDHVVEGLLALLRPGIEVGGRRMDLEVAIGIAEAEGANRRDAVGRALRAADHALASGSRWQRYNEELNRELDWRLSLVGELDQAMANRDIWVAYQPKLDIALGRITAAEALVRWKHPVRGPISPAEFIPALEESGRVFDLTLFVLEQALWDINRWGERGIEINVAVNVSALLPSDPRFADAVEELLGRYGTPPAQLTLEVTESVSINDPEAAIAGLERLAGLGVALSIDDYGTGQSTLSYLKRLPAREIKIDQSFVTNLADSRSDQAMVRSTIQLAHELGFKVVAEGIETEPVLNLLRGFGCDVAQGWQIGRPVPADELSARLTAEQARAAA